MTLTVRELINMLERCDGNARVYFVAQPSYPFEYTVEDVKVRNQCAGCEPDPCEDCGGSMKQEEDEHGDPILQCSKCTSHKKLGREDAHPTDVLIVEGEQVRYASKMVFE